MPQPPDFTTDGLLNKANSGLEPPRTKQPLKITDSHPQSNGAVWMSSGQAPRIGGGTVSFKDVSGPGTPSHPIWTVTKPDGEKTVFEGLGIKDGRPTGIDASGHGNFQATITKPNGEKEVIHQQGATGTHTRFNARGQLVTRFTTGAGRFTGRVTGAHAPAVSNGKHAFHGNQFTAHGTDVPVQGPQARNKSVDANTPERPLMLNDSETLQWLRKAMDTPKYPDVQMPNNLNSTNNFVERAKVLEAKARILDDMHENRAFDGREPFTDEDYAAFSAAHKDLADSHRVLGEDLKAAMPDALQAISAHGNAMAYHNGASKLAEMMEPSAELGERNLMWPHMDSNQFRFGHKGPWDTEEKNWRKAHQAFIASQYAARQTAFDTGVVEKGMDESLADILRHDKGHDDWHAMHGDEPCTSEADCAAKRAKYAEVKAEEAASVSKGGPEEAPRRGKYTMRDAQMKYLRERMAERRASGEKAGDEGRGTGSHTVGDFPGHPFRGNQYSKSVEVVEKGDVPGHIFHGNQYITGTTSIPDNVGGRDFDAKSTLGQIGQMNILSVSGGKVHSIHDTDGAVVGLELPVSSGYKVRVFLADDDTYTVQRVHRDNVKGEQTGVYADEVGESVYQAGMYKSNPFGGHSPR